MSEFGILDTAAAGMDAQRFALDVAARNVAAAEVADPAHPFARLVPQFSVADDSRDAGVGPGDATSFGTASDEDSTSDDGSISDDAGVPELPPLRAVGTRALRGVDVDAVTEMVAVLNAQRAYEADASVFDAGKRLAERTIDVGRL